MSDSPQALTHDMSTRSAMPTVKTARYPADKLGMPAVTVVEGQLEACLSSIAAQVPRGKEQVLVQVLVLRSGLSTE